MSWLSEFIRPKLQAVVGRQAVPDLWTKCPGCDRMMFHKELDAQLRVCSACGHHLQMPVSARLELLFDDGSYELMELPAVEEDPLRFRDRKRYTERLKVARAESDAADAIAVATGEIGARRSVVAVLDFGFMGGSMGMAVGEGLVRAAEFARKDNLPLIAVTASGGARMQEGILSLMQLPRTVAAIEDARESGCPYVVILTHPTTGGVTASFAMLGDVALAEPGALIGFAGPRVIENTVGETLPENFQRAEKVCELGMIDAVVPRSELKATLVRILAHLTNGPLPPREDTTAGSTSVAVIA
ncbi:MAG: acetyl-CoA carboxylase, carboxyltransferase subunit beta [Rhodospirillales bacterium]|nr:acetyl-CoA carboxylase, carboxyltransferase subunit beta [Rhodospirillales bacterium]